MSSMGRLFYTLSCFYSVYCLVYDVHQHNTYFVYSIGRFVRFDVRPYPYTEYTKGTIISPAKCGTYILSAFVFHRRTTYRLLSRLSTGQTLTLCKVYLISSMAALNNAETVLV